MTTKQTKMVKPSDADVKWYLIDATDVVLGRLASQIATILRGKNKACFTPNQDCGDYVIVINYICQKIHNLMPKKLLLLAKRPCKKPIFTTQDSLVELRKFS